MGGNESHRFRYFPMGFHTHQPANPTKCIQIRHKSYANPTQILCKSERTFLEKANLEGPAVTLYANGVAGQDLFELHVNGLVGLRLSAFAAGKITPARHSFLAAP